jgi:hypothetical protein
MAATRITLTQTEQAQNLAVALRQIREARDRLGYAVEVANACIDTATTPANYTMLEEVFGVPAGQGQTVYNLIAGAQNKIDAPDIKTAIARMG